MNDPTQAKCLTDPAWKFYKDTDLRRTFARIRRQLKAEEAAKEAKQSVKVAQIRAKERV